MKLWIQVAFIFAVSIFLKILHFSPQMDVLTSPSDLQSEHLRSQSKIKISLNQLGLPTVEQVRQIMQQSAIGDPMALEALFEITPGPSPKSPAYLVTISVSDFVRERLKQIAQKYGMALYILRPEMGPLALDSDSYLKIIRRLNPQILLTFVDETYTAEFWNPETTPNLGIVIHAARGTGNLNINHLAVHRPEVKISYLGGKPTPLDSSVAENAVAKILYGWFRLRQMETVKEELKFSESMGGVLTQVSPINSSFIAQMAVAQLLSSAKNLERAFEFVKAGQFYGCGNGKRTVENYQLREDAEAGIFTTVGLTGSPETVRGIAKYLASFGIHRIYYTGDRLSAEEEDQLSLTFIKNFKKFIELSDFIVKTPGSAKRISDKLYQQESEKRNYPWLIDFQRIRYRDRHLRFLHTLRTYGNDLVSLEGVPCAILGLGSIGEPIARMLRALGLELMAIRHDPDDPEKREHYDRLEGELGIQFFDKGQIRQLFHYGKIVVSVIPDNADSRGLFSAERVNDPSTVTQVWVNEGRGSLVNTKDFYAAIAQRNMVSLSDVTENEFLPLTEQPWRSSLGRRHFQTPHFDSNGFDPRPKRRISRGGKTIVFASRGQEALGAGGSVRNLMILQAIKSSEAYLEDKSVPFPIIPEEKKPKSLQSAL